MTQENKNETLPKVEALADIATDEDKLFHDGYIQGAAEYLKTCATPITIAMTVILPSLTPVAMSTRYLQTQMNPRLSRTAVPPSKTLTSKAPRTPFEFRYSHLK